MTNPWIFGWTQVFTLVGFAITIAIAIGGFRTFARWKREKLEERRIEIALEVLAVAYESKYVFDHIRTPLSSENEWSDMPRQPGDTDDEYRARGPYYAVGKRVIANKDFFDKVFQLQPRCMAVFGAKAEETFLKMHKARREIEVAASMLAWKVHNPIQPGENRDADFWEQCRRDIWDHGTFEPEKDKVGKKLSEFRTEIEALCRPVVDNELGPLPKISLSLAEKVFDKVLGII